MNAERLVAIAAHRQRTHALQQLVLLKVMLRCLMLHPWCIVHWGTASPPAPMACSSQCSNAGAHLGCSGQAPAARPQVADVGAAGAEGAVCRRVLQHPAGGRQREAALTPRQLYTSSCEALGRQPQGMGNGDCCNRRRRRLGLTASRSATAPCSAATLRPCSASSATVSNHGRSAVIVSRFRSLRFPRTPRASTFPGCVS